MTGKTLFDKFRGYASVHSRDGRPEQRMFSDVAVAKGFTLTDNFTRYAAQASLYRSKYLIALADAAYPPRTPMFLEWNRGTQLASLTGEPQDVTARMGALVTLGGIDTYDVTLVCVMDDDDCITAPFAFRYRVGSPIDADPDDEMRAFEDLKVPILVRGESEPMAIYTVKEMLVTSNLQRRDTAAELASRVAVYFSPANGADMRDVMAEAAAEASPRRFQELTSNAVKSQAGNLRFVWAALGLINLMRVTVGEEEKSGEGQHFYKRRLVPYMSSRTVDLVVPSEIPERYIRRLIAASRRMRHDVNGHFRHYHRSAVRCLTLDHRWEPLPETRREACRLCGMERMWIAYHWRGDASLGYVDHEYRVKTPDDVIKE